MAAFNAGAVVEPLDYDFRTADNPAGKHGVIREPTDAQIAKFLTELRALQAEMAQAAKKTGEQIEGLAEADDPVALLADIHDADEALGFLKRMAALHADLCSGTPSADDVMALPMRIRSMFFTWLQREVTNPEAVPGGGNAQVVNLRPAAAG